MRREWEELALKASHHFLLTATRGSLGNSLLFLQPGPKVRKELGMRAGGGRRGTYEGWARG